MTVAILSAFRNADYIVERFIGQVAGLRSAGVDVRLIIGEGDSVDDTLPMLRRTVERSRLPATILDCSHGGRMFGSVVDAERFRQLAHVGNMMLDRVTQDDDSVVIVECDLLWTTEAMVALLARLANYDVVVPMVMQGDRFYDTWAYRAGGEAFQSRAPYAHGLDGQMYELESAGSCIAMTAEIAREYRETPEEALVGLCRNIRAGGHRIYLDPTIRIDHP